MIVPAQGQLRAAGIVAYEADLFHIGDRLKKEIDPNLSLEWNAELNMIEIWYYNDSNGEWYLTKRMPPRKPDGSTTLTPDIIEEYRRYDTGRHGFDWYDWVKEQERMDAAEENRIQEEFDELHKDWDQFLAAEFPELTDKTRPVFFRNKDK